MRALISLFLLIWLPLTAAAQGAATLVADSVTLNGDGQLVATGNVEAFFEGNTLSASQVTFDKESDTLTVLGPILIKSADGAILTADTATLDPRLENGILQSARIVLEQQLQMAASQINRRDGRYSQLYKTSVTSCRVCGTQTPLWDIRAERVIHDAEEQQLYFTNATLRVRGVPVFWLPRMRLPDPSLKRATGLLVPEQRNTTQLGFGLKLPYFITLGDSRDVTLTPYVSQETRTLEMQYRQAFSNGSLTVDGAVSDDTLADTTRSYLFAEAQFDLRNDYQLSFDIEAVSDTAYLVDYGYSDKDRLDSAIELLRVTDSSLYRARLTNYQTLRDDESDASLPPIIADIFYQGSTAPAFGGRLAYSASADIGYRYSTDNGDDGRDVARAGLAGAWSNSFVLPSGIVADVQTGLQADVYHVTDDTDYTDDDLRVSPSAGIVLRWPLARTGNAGTTHLLEPTVSLGWAETYGGTPPNEDSLRTELDRANLLSLSRYAGEDRIETGAQAAVGLTWTRFGAAGVTTALSFGRVYRAHEQDGFTATSGLDGRQSDWLISGQVTAPGGFLFDARTLWDDALGLTVADSRVAWQNDRITLGANYVWLRPDADEDRTDTISEWTVDASVVLNNAWTFDFDGQYDVADARATSAGIGLQWKNECVTIDVSASRRFTSSSTVDPATTFGISGSVGSFATGGFVARCEN